MKHVGGGGAFSRVLLLSVFGHCGGGKIFGILSLDERERERGSECSCWLLGRMNMRFCIER